MKNLVTLSLIFISFACFSQSNLDSGLIAYYPLNNSIKDSSTNGLNGSLVNGKYEKDRFGNDYSALYCNGTTDYAKVNGFGGHFPEGDFTMCLWAKSIKNVTSNTLMLMNDNSSNRVNLSLYYSHNGQGGLFWDYGSINSRIFIEPVSPSGKWEFFVVYYNSKTKKIGLYRDLMLLQEVTNNSPYTADAKQNLNIGMGKDGYYNGTLDDIRFYSRLLSSAEMKVLYQGNSNKIQTYTSENNLVQIIPDAYMPKVFNINSNIPVQMVEVYNTSGQIFPQTDSTKINLSTCASGIYCIRITDTQGKTYFKKLLI